MIPGGLRITGYIFATAMTYDLLDTPNYNTNHCQNHQSTSASLQWKKKATTLMSEKQKELKITLKKLVEIQICTKRWLTTSPFTYVNVNLNTTRRSSLRFFPSLYCCLGAFSCLGISLTVFLFIWKLYNKTHMTDKNQPSECTKSARRWMQICENW